ncbi:unnamed protein product [Gongylonema pulchrum]|uniref:BAR_3_WASP_bdg domain-containing protein n=1 Tax=Gongylonema pulchrum TaxID=637853 RepID=A0A183D9T4_9BILA|nr:unnamed protein product [Gongylonema pulchrum]
MCLKDLSDKAEAASKTYEEHLQNVADRVVQYQNYFKVSSSFPFLSKNAFLFQILTILTLKCYFFIEVIMQLMLKFSKYEKYLRPIGQSVQEITLKVARDFGKSGN